MIKKFITAIVTTLFLLGTSPAYASNKFVLDDETMDNLTAGRYVAPGTMQRWVFDWLKFQMKGNPNKFGNWGKKLNESNFRDKITIQQPPDQKTNNNNRYITLIGPNSTPQGLTEAAQAKWGKDWNTRLK